MYVRSRSNTPFIEPHALIRTIAYLLAWAVLLAAIGLIAAYVSPAPAGGARIEEPGPLHTSAPTSAPAPSGPAAPAPGSPISLVSVVRGTSRAATGAY
ncbi:MAG TPA: hypothetical protein VMC83_12000 [Streptosporangiaceae bacterium]|nr:hypothetical protein [Streptosporangiaceae bacterium]